MEVHPPEHPILTKRDFFVHLFTITIGLLIALTLESAVEYLHHRHLVHEARRNIRQEIADNHDRLHKNIIYIQRAFDMQSANLKVLRHMRGDPKSKDNSNLDFGFSFTPPEDSAWTTARDTGALSYMSYEEAKNFSRIYRVQGIFNAQAIELIRSEEVSAGPALVADDGKDFAPADIDALLHNAASIKLQVESLKTIGGQLDETYLEEMKQKP